MREDERTSNRPEPRRLGWFAFAGLVLTLAGPVLFYLFFLDQPFLRSTGLPAIVLMLVGLAVGVWAIYGDRRLRIRILGGLNLLLAVLVVIYFGYGMVLPAGSPPAAGEAAPDFTLTNHAGEQVTLSRTLSAGPVLLVFYRGYW
jgi:succinate dehydrogenase hydrophobic anchor subunit